MPTAVQLLLDRHGAKAPRDDGSELLGRIWYNMTIATAVALCDARQPAFEIALLLAGEVHCHYRLVP